MTDWNELRTLLAVARAQTIAAAARQLGVSHSTVYRRVKNFEDQNNITLFERHTDKLRLTEAGQSFLELAGDVEDAVNKLGQNLRRFDHDVDGVVSIGAPEAAGLLLCPRLSDFGQRFPKLTLSWELDADTASLLRRETDVAIVVAAEPPGNLVGRRLVDIEFAVYGSIEYLEREGLASTEGARWIVFGKSLAEMPLVQWERANVSEQAIAMRVNRRVMLDEAVLSGLGIGVMPRLSGDANPRLRRLTESIDLKLPLWVLTHPDLRESAAVRAVFDEVTRLLGDEHNRRIQGLEAD